MIISFNKNVHDVDMGMFGKKSLNIDVKLKHEKDAWKLITAYVYVIHNDGKLSPIQDNVYSLQWLTTVVNQCLDEAKTITEWKHK